MVRRPYGLLFTRGPREEALVNIREAIAEFLAAQAGQPPGEAGACTVLHEEVLV